MNTQQTDARAELIAYYSEQYRKFGDNRDKQAAALLAADAQAGEEAVDMVLYCPKCHTQHIDAPKACDMGVGCDDYGNTCYAKAHGQPERCPAWTNPPHKSHLCHGCGHIWRPSDTPTNGVARTQSGKDNDTAPAVGGHGQG